MKILVTDAGERSALAVIRSLGRAGHDVVAGASGPSIGAASRYSSESARLPDPLTAADAFATDVRNTVAARAIEMVIPVTDASMSALLARADDLRDVQAALPFADRDDYLAISDKAGLLREAAAVGLAVPDQRTLATSDADIGGVRYPVVVKPSRSVVEGDGTRVKTRVAYAGTEAELENVLERLPPGAYPLLLQERIVGDDVGVFLLRWDRRIVAAFSHRRIREKPPSGGVSVLRESHPLDRELYDRSVALLDRFEWRGPAMIELKVDQGTGTAYVMEVNGRYWGSLQLAIDAGVDFPALHVAVASGRQVAPVVDYPLGVRTRWTLGDLDHLLLRLRHSRDRLGLSETAPGRARALIDFVRAFGPGTRAEVLRWSDPMPGFVELRQWVRDVL